MRWCLALLFSATAAPALEIVETARYDLNRPASLDYDPAFCGLWIANEGPEVILVTLQGDELRRFGSDLSRIKAITLEGDNLLVADGFGAFQRLTKSGDPIAAPFKVPGGWADTEGIAIDGDGQIISVEDDPERLSWLAADGTPSRVINTADLTPPIFEAQGIARDPRTGHDTIANLELHGGGNDLGRKRRHGHEREDERGLARYVDCGCLVMKTEGNGYLASVIDIMINLNGIFRN